MMTVFGGFGATGVPLVQSQSRITPVPIHSINSLPATEALMVAVSLRTRKPVDQLTLRDFAAFPVWEYATDEEGITGRDETWVRPVDTAVVPKRSYMLVAANFTAACGKKYSGSVTISTLDGVPEVCQGTILRKGKSLFVSNAESFFFRESLEQLLAALGLKQAEVFPLSFRLRVPVAGHPKYFGGVLPPDPKKP